MINYRNQRNDSDRSLVKYRHWLKCLHFYLTFYRDKKENFSKYQSSIFSQKLNLTVPKFYHVLIVPNYLCKYSISNKIFKFNIYII